MTTDAELDEKLARVRRRVEARGTETRDRLDALGILALAEAARETFGARLVWLRDEHGEIGREPERGQVWDLDVRPTPRAAEVVEPAIRATPRRKRKRTAPVATWHDRYGA